MSPTSISPDGVAPLETPGDTDRRSECRHPIVLRPQYKLIRNRRRLRTRSAVDYGRRIWRGSNGGAPDPRAVRCQWFCDKFRRCPRANPSWRMSIFAQLPGDCPKDNAPFTLGCGNIVCRRRGHVSSAADSEAAETREAPLPNVRWLVCDRKKPCQRADILSG